MDEIDLANEAAARELARREHAARQAASSIPTGTPGDCDLCGEWTGHLVGGACAPCRDLHHLP